MSEETSIKEIRRTVKEFNEGMYGYNLALSILSVELEKALNLIEKRQEQLQENDKIIDKLITEITAVNSGRYEYMDNDRVLEIFTKKAREV